MNIAAFKIFGANPIPMPFSEVYTGLETRTIDAGTPYQRRAVLEIL